MHQAHILFSILIASTSTLLGLARIMSASQFITRSSKIINIGHLPGHVNGKIIKLREAGFTNTVAIITKDWTKAAILAELEASPSALFIVGGAMNKEYPDLMAELNAFIQAKVPSMLVHNTTAADFPAGCAFPPSEEIVAASAVTIALRLLKEEGL
jgi:hypothetical protein